MKPATRRRILQIEPGETRLVVMSALCVFFLMMCYALLRPLREAYGISESTRALPYLWTGTFIAMIAATVAYSQLVAVFPRRIFIPVTNRFFAITFLLLFVFLHFYDSLAARYIFYVWISVFNLFVLSVFWGLMADTFSSSQSKRLFGIIAAGAAVGAICGPLLSSVLVDSNGLGIGPQWLFLIAVVLLEAATQTERIVIRRRERRTHLEVARATPTGDFTAIGGTALSGIAHVLRSPYLMGIAAYILLMTHASTYLYFMQATIIEAAVETEADRVALFARIDLLTNVLTPLLQLFVVARLIRWIGLGLVLAMTPIICIAGFAALAVAPSLLIIVVVQVAARSSRYAIAKPARETLYTVLATEDKYKAKAFIDTVVYRGGDVMWAWMFDSMRDAGATLRSLALGGAAAAAIWCVVGMILGHRHTTRAQHLPDPSIR